MTGASIMKELTSLNNKYTEWELKKENNFSRSRNFDFGCIHFNIFDCLEWLEKPLWLIIFCDITDMFIKYRSMSLYLVCQNGVLDSFEKFTRSCLCRSLLLKKWQATGWLKRNSDTGVFLWIVKNFKEHHFEELLQVAVNNDSKYYNNNLLRESEPPAPTGIKKI